MSKKKDKSRPWTKVEMIDYELITDYYPELFRLRLAIALSKLPDEVLERVFRECIFVMEEPAKIGELPEGHSSYLSFRTPSFKNRKGIIILSWRLYFCEPREIAFSVAHEVAHFIHDDIPVALELDRDIKKPPTLKETLSIEVRADKQAVKWLSSHYKKSALMKRCNYWKLKRKND